MPVSATTEHREVALLTTDIVGVSGDRGGGVGGVVGYVRTQHAARTLVGFVLVLVEWRIFY